MLSKEEFIKTFLIKTAIPVAPSMERALGYFGVSRWVAFHWSRRYNSPCWADARFNSCRSASTIWHRFLAHPFVVPYLQVWRPDMRRLETLSFEAKDDDPETFPVLPNGEIDVSALDLDSARFIEESQKLAYAIVLDRAKRTVYVARWLHAFVFLMFYRDENPDDTVRELLRENGLDERPFEMLRKILREDSDEKESNDSSKSKSSCRRMGSNWWLGMLAGSTPIWKKTRPNLPNARALNNFPLPIAFLLTPGSELV